MAELAALNARMDEIVDQISRENSQNSQTRIDEDIPDSH